jgi:hypothetical protein
MIPSASAATVNRLPPHSAFCGLHVQVLRNVGIADVNRMCGIGNPAHPGNAPTTIADKNSSPSSWKLGLSKQDKGKPFMTMNRGGWGGGGGGGSWPETEAPVVNKISVLKVLTLISTLVMFSL